MKIARVILALVLFGVAGIGSAWADRGHGGHGGHGHFGVMIDIPWGPWYYPPAYYYPPYYPPVVIQPQAPQVYIEPQQAPSASTAPSGSVAEVPANYWYYCGTAKGYYPYVKECPSGWQKVLPQPPDRP